MFFLATELGMTLSQLTEQLTQEELVGWAAFYELKSEEQQAALDRSRTSRGAQTMAAR